MTADSTENIYTEKQKKYVAGVKDEHLRDHLLYQTRLRDNMEADRNAFEKQIQKHEEVRDDERKRSFFDRVKELFTCHRKGHYNDIGVIGRYRSAYCQVCHKRRELW